MMNKSSSLLTHQAISPLQQAGLIDDPWSRGVHRISGEPVVLSLATAAALAEAACAVAMMLDHAVQAIAADAQLANDVGLSPSLAALARLDAPRWLALARADVFLVPGHLPQVCEINCDTPTGLAECTELGRVATDTANAAAESRPGFSDPSARLRERWLTMVRSCIAGDHRGAVVGLIDATEMTEDLGHVRLLSRWLHDDGFTVVRGSPFNLHACPGQRVGLFGVPCSVLIRHYKTDWWAERSSPWSDEPPPPSATSLTREIALIAEAMAAGTVAVLNPWGAAFGQSKRTLALPWERPSLFSAEMQDLTRRHLPETRFMSSLSVEQLHAEREQWVLKSDFGCEGDEVVMGSLTTAEAWATAVRVADPQRWVVQRAFTPELDRDGYIVNHGVFLIGGMPSGIFSRRSRGPTDDRALASPTLVAT